MFFVRGRAAEVRAIDKAARSLRAALALLDRIDVPADIGAHVDLAVCRLEEVRRQRLLN